MPVFNGAATLEAALRSVQDQTLQDIEIIISDNCSTDGTEQLCQRLAAQDTRIRYIRQPKALSPTDNFRFVLGKATAPYFMWAAHDDTRDLDTAEKLISALDQSPKAVLAFGNLVQVIDGIETPWPLDFTNRSLGRSSRLWRGATGQLHHLYGIWRTDQLRRIDWRHVDWWHDTPVIMAAAMLGDFIHVEGPRFIYLYNPRPFFGWRKKPGPHSIGNDIRELAVRTRELFLLVWLSGRTVARVAGPLRGVEAALYTAIKVLQQVTGFLWRRLPGAAPAPKGS